MGRKVFFSFLGLGTYEEVCYFIDEAVASPTKYIQLALIELFWSDWGEDDVFYILMTDGARDNNWEDLKKQLTEVSENGYSYDRYSLEIKTKIIPNGFNEQEILQIFEIIYDLINEGDKIYFDITHSFRSIPFVSSIIFNYSSLLKSAEIVSVLYGAFESKTNEKGCQKKKVPILDLSTFIYLNRLTMAVKVFDNTGDVSELSLLFNQERGKLYSTEKRLGKLFSERERELSNFNRAIKFVRGKNIDRMDIDSILSKTNYPENFPQPFRTLFEKFVEKLRRKVGEYGLSGKGNLKKEIKNQLIAIIWCIEHDLVQQGFTLLRELIITRIMLALEKEDIYDEDAREKVTRMITSAIQLNQGDASKEEGQGSEVLGMDINKFKKRFEVDIRRYDQIKGSRNDLNHGGFRSHSFNAEKLRGELRKLLESYLKYLLETQDSK